MNGRGLKTLVIAVLLIVNAVFGALIAADSAGERRKIQREKDDLITVMAKNGIELSESAIPPEAQVHVLRSERNAEEEALIAAALLGESTVSDAGGLASYENENGSARFRSNGEFEIELYKPIDASKGEEKTARELPYGEWRKLPEKGVICIDTGCGKGGRLTAMAIEDARFCLESVAEK